MRTVFILYLFMGLFSKLFGQTKLKNFDSSVEKELRSEFNVMTNFTLEKCQKCTNSKQFKLIEKGIYIDLKDSENTKYRMTISYDLETENKTNNQYPLEGILDKYKLYVSDFLESENKSDLINYTLELAGELDD